MPDSQTLNVYPRNTRYTKQSKYPFFTLDNSAVLVNVTKHSNENCKEWMTFVLKNCLLVQLTKMLEMKIHTAYKNCTPILAHHFNSHVYQSHR